MAVLAIVASFAMPAWRGYVQRAHRHEARAALLALAAAQEKYFLSCGSYAPSIDGTSPTSCTPASLRFDARSERAQYVMRVISADAADWQATATAAPGTGQFGDAACRTFTLSATGEKRALRANGTDNSRECWSR